MYIKKSELKAIEEIFYGNKYNFVPRGEAFENLPEETKEAILSADRALMAVYCRNRKTNKKKNKA